MDVVSLADVTAAHELLRPVIDPTPLEQSRWLAALVGGPVYLKCENLQRTGSFKIRGAYVRISRLSERERARGVVAASAGNHAQGVALAARMLDTQATVFMPQGAAIVKEKATLAYGAQVRFAGTTVSEALVAAQEYADRTGAVLIHPFDHPDVIAGQATVGVEILEQCPQARTVVVSAGGGGLIAGIALAVRKGEPAGPAGVRVVGVQADGAATYPASLAAGTPVSVDRMSTMADGIAVGRPGDVPFGLVHKYVDEVVTVTEELLSRALVQLLERAKMVVEPAGAAGVAALLDAPQAFEPPVVVVLSGGNIDPLVLLRVIRHGMSAAGRYLAVRVRVPDRPGALARLLAELAALEVNVLDVVHERTSAWLSVDEVEVFLQLETRGREHCERVLAALAASGYQLLRNEY